jgi:hypothetical protein
MKGLRLATTVAVAVILHPVLGSAERDGRRADPLPAPANLTCAIDGSVLEVVLSWDAVEGATKYAVDFECEDPTGTVRMDVEYEPEERLIATSASVPFDAFPAEVVLDGDGAAWTCLAKVKGLNPPGRKQAHAQAVALCQ